MLRPLRKGVDIQLTIPSPPSGAEKVFQSVVPGAHGRTHPTIAGGGHFLQEDKGPELASAIVAFVAATPVS